MTKSVRDMIADGDFENNVPYRPDDSEYKTIDPENMTGKEIREAKEYNLQVKRRQQVLHGEETRRLNDLFKIALAEEHGVKDHPKADRLFSLAWEYGHSSGYHDVEFYYSELVELIR